MKKVIAILLALCMLASLAACSGTEKEDGFNLTACIASEPETLDPNMESSVDGAVYSLHLFEGLIKYAPTETLAGEDADVNYAQTVGGQAERWEVSDDGLTYTFYLRNDIFWSDGQPVTAGDFVYSWQRLVNPKTAADYGYLLDGVVKNAAEIQAGDKDASELGVSATDDKTFVVELESECPYFESLCTFAALVPVRKDIIEANDTAWTNPGTMVSNGAYVLSEWTHDSYILFAKNDKYYDIDSIGPDTIKWYLNDSETAILSSYKTGEYDFMYNVPTDQIASLKSAGDLYIIDQICTYYLYLNCDKITDWRVRAAINLAVDRENIVEKVTQAGQTPATGFVPAGITDNGDTDWTTLVGKPLYDWLAAEYPDADLTTYDGRCALAKKLVDAAKADGWDETATIDYQYNTSEAHQAIAEAVQSDLSDILGISVTLSNSEWQTYTTNLGEGNFGLARLGWSADYDDAITYLELFTNGNSYNYGKWTSDEYTKLITDAKALPGGAARDEKMMEAEKLMFSEDGFPIVPLYFYTQLYCMADGITNVSYSPLGYFFFMYAKQADAAGNEVTTTAAGDATTVAADATTVADDATTVAADATTVA